MTSHKNDSTFYGIPIGAVTIRKESVQDLRTFLESTLQRKIRFRGVECDSNQQVIVHLPPIAAIAFMDGLCDDFLTLQNAQFHLGRRRRKRPKKSNPNPINTDRASSTSKAQFTFVELFAGIGGFRLGLEEIGGRCVLSNEMSPHPARIFRQHFGSEDSLVECDVLDLGNDDIPDGFTMLTAGFPCQPFSTRGDQKGLDDVEKGQLFQELVRVLRAKQPPCFLFENVAGLVTMDGGKRKREHKDGTIETTFISGNAFEKILDCFRNCGYSVEWRIVNARHWVPQYRERVYIVGTRTDLNCSSSFNWDRLVQHNPRQPDKTIRKILEPKGSDAVAASFLSAPQIDKVKEVHSNKNGTLKDASFNLDDLAPTLISSYHRIGSFSTKFVVDDEDGSGIRFLTHRECCRIMGFPESFPVPNDSRKKVESAQFYQAIGNAVVPPVISAIGSELLSMVCWPSLNCNGGTRTPNSGDQNEHTADEDKSCTGRPANP